MCAFLPECLLYPDRVKMTSTYNCSLLGCSEAVTVEGEYIKQGVRTTDLRAGHDLTMSNDTRTEWFCGWAHAAEYATRKAAEQ